MAQPARDRFEPPTRWRHPLTEEFIQLVGGGMDPREACMSLIGPMLSLGDVENALFDWEFDPDVKTRIEALISERVKAAQTVRNSTIERLISILNCDIRRFYQQSGDPEHPKVRMIPVTQWTGRMSGAVKKFKHVQKTDPFGSVTETINLEFHDPFSALKELRELAPEVFEIVRMSKDDNAIDVEVLEQMSDEELAVLHTKLLKAV